jgi:hypothetical protein
MISGDRKRSDRTASVASTQTSGCQPSPDRLPPEFSRKRTRARPAGATMDSILVKIDGRKASRRCHLRVVGKSYTHRRLNTALSSTHFRRTSLVQGRPRRNPCEMLARRVRCRRLSCTRRGPALSPTTTRTAVRHRTDQRPGDRHADREWTTEDAVPTTCWPSKGRHDQGAA